MSTVNNQTVISQVNQNMLNKLQPVNPQKSSVPTGRTQKSQMAQNALSAPNERGKGDYITIAGKTIEKKKAVIGLGAAILAVAGFGILIFNNIKKGKKPTHKAPAAPSNGNSIKSKKPAAKKAGSKTAEKLSKKEPAKGPKKNTAKKAPKNNLTPETQPVKPIKTPEEIQAEIQAEAKRRTILAKREAQAVERENVYIQKIFGIKPDGTRVPPEKSAKESAVFIQKSLKMKEKAYAKMPKDIADALGGDFKDILCESANSFTSGQMKKIIKNAEALKQEFTPEELKKLASSEFHIQTLLGDYLKGIDNIDGRAKIIEYLKSVLNEIQ